MVVAWPPNPTHNPQPHIKHTRTHPHTHSHTLTHTMSLKNRELDFAGVYRVPAASLKALGTAPEGKGAPDVELVTKGGCDGVGVGAGMVGGGMG